METKFDNSNQHRGIFHSFKSDKTIFYDTELEGNFLYRLEFDMEVARFARFDSLLQAINCSHPQGVFPSFFVEKRDGRQEIVLLQSPEILALPKAPSARSRMEAFCRENWLGFAVLTESQVQDGALVNNLKILYKHANTPHLVKDMFSVRDVFKARVSASRGELNRLVSDENMISMFLFQSVLYADLSAEIINDLTTVTPGTLLDGYVAAVQEILIRDAGHAPLIRKPDG